jgi:hypothetical protein
MGCAVRDAGGADAGAASRVLAAPAQEVFGVVTRAACLLNGDHDANSKDFIINLFSKSSLSKEYFFLFFSFLRRTYNEYRDAATSGRLLAAGGRGACVPASPAVVQAAAPAAEQ